MGEDAESPSPSGGGGSRSDRVGKARRDGRGCLDRPALPTPTSLRAVDPPPEGEGDTRYVLSADVLAQCQWWKAAHKGQRPPIGNWRTWVFLGGRGAGKTRAGAEWVWETAQALGAGGRIALVAPTIRDARTVMVEGPSGLLRLPYRDGARFASSKREVTFPGGAVGMLFSAEEPERLRGPQFHAAWGDEFCAWGRCEETLAMLRLGLRLGEGPRLVLTSTPKPGRVLRGVLGEDGCARTHAATQANEAHLAPGFLAAMEGLYGGTRRAAQELEGRVLEADGALFTLAEIERARGLGKEMGLQSPSPSGGGWSRSDRVGTARQDGRGCLDRPALPTPTSLRAVDPPPEGEGEAPVLVCDRVGTARQDGRGCLDRPALPTPTSLRAVDPPPEGEGEAPVVVFDRVVVAVDPPAGTLSGRARDACGIVVVGRRGDRAAVLADWTARGLSPEGWAERVRRAVEAYAADRVVVETNNGGAMAEAVLKASGLSVPVRRVHASVGKVARAEPVAALYEQGRVAHAPALEALEEELMGLGSEDAGGGSPDRADALVWAVTELMPAPGSRGPRVRWL